MANIKQELNVGLKNRYSYRRMQRENKRELLALHGPRRNSRSCGSVTSSELERLDKEHTVLSLVIPEELVNGMHETNFKTFLKDIPPQFLMYDLVNKAYIFGKDSLEQMALGKEVEGFRAMNEQQISKLKVGTPAYWYFTMVKLGNGVYNECLKKKK